MNRRHSLVEQELRFFGTSPRACSYLPNRSAVSVFADPYARLSTALYEQLAGLGFRRSGGDLYVPACPDCRECVPVRIPVHRFKRSRNQQKIWNRNRDLMCRLLPPEFRDDHFALYTRYLDSRHPGGGMDRPTPDEYLSFLTSDWCETLFVELRLDGAPVAVAVTDRLGNALSAVYTFFDPELKRRSLGTYAVLRQIELARATGCDWHYLGYWIAGSDKMRYKSRFRPMQAYRGGEWRTLETDRPAVRTPAPGRGSTNPQSGR
ncbi:MAG: arginyltransferase [Gammaproteobacteria bacterium]|jgi:arginine-tRNA-protein transferase